MSTLLIVFGLFVGSTIVAAGPFTAYSDPAVDGNQSTPSASFGMDFDVLSPISVSALGAFDGLPRGLMGSITVEIWDRTNRTRVPGLSLVIKGVDGSLEGGDRMVTLGSPVTLPAGFQGSIVASGYGADMNGNGIVFNPKRNFSNTNNGGGLISFVKGTRQGNPGVFPAPLMSTGFDGQYGGATFKFDKVPPPPPRPFLAAISVFFKTLDGHRVVWGVVGVMGLILATFLWRSRRH